MTRTALVVVSEEERVSGPKDDLDNHANQQLNDNNDAYWQSRGHDERPADWQGHDANDWTPDMEPSP